MITEIMGFLILLGAAIVFIVRWQSGKERQPVRDREDMQYSTYQLKQELERTGSEIVSRIEQHVTHLEQLIREADRSKSVLDGRIAELRELVRLGDEQMDAMHTLRSEIVEARQLQQHLSEAGRQISGLMQAGSMQMERVDSQDFSEVLQRSMARDDMRSGQDEFSYPVQQVPEVQPMYAPVPAPAPEASAAEPPTYEVTEEPESAPDNMSYDDTAAEGTTEQTGDTETEQVLTDSARVRGLLISGWSVEDTARETGMGRGAVELMQQMLRRQMGDKTTSES